MPLFQKEKQPVPTPHLATVSADGGVEAAGEWVARGRAAHMGQRRQRESSAGQRLQEEGGFNLDLHK